MKHKPRPAVIYREEYQNEHGEWVCSRMSYDEKQYDGWRELDRQMRSASWYRKRRFLRGVVLWAHE